jgi:hypothetical protein
MASGSVGCVRVNAVAKPVGAPGKEEIAAALPCLKFSFRSRDVIFAARI